MRISIIKEDSIDNDETVVDEKRISLDRIDGERNFNYVRSILNDYFTSNNVTDLNIVDLINTRIELSPIFRDFWFEYYIVTPFTDQFLKRVNYRRTFPNLKDKICFAIAVTKNVDFMRDSCISRIVYEFLKHHDAFYSDDATVSYRKIYGDVNVCRNFALEPNQVYTVCKFNHYSAKQIFIDDNDYREYESYLCDNLESWGYCRYRFYPSILLKLFAKMFDATFARTQYLKAYKRLFETKRNSFKLGF